MFANFGFTELLLILGIALLLFGKRLPKLGRSLGDSVRQFKRGLKEEPQQQQSQETSAQKSIQAIPVPSRRLASSQEKSGEK